MLMNKLMASRNQREGRYAGRVLGYSYRKAGQSNPDSAVVNRFMFADRPKAGRLSRRMWKR